MELQLCPLKKGRLVSANFMVGFLLVSLPVVSVAPPRKSDFGSRSV